MYPIIESHNAGTNCIPLLFSHWRLGACNPSDLCLIAYWVCGYIACGYAARGYEIDYRYAFIACGFEMCCE